MVITKNMDMLLILYVILMINLVILSTNILCTFQRNKGVQPYDNQLCFSWIYTHCCESGINWYIMNKYHDQKGAISDEAMNDFILINQNNVISINEGEDNVNILCFGDSLTAGYCNDGKEYHPYSKELE